MADMTPRDHYVESGRLLEYVAENMELDDPEGDALNGAMTRIEMARVHAELAKCDPRVVMSLPDEENVLDWRP